MGFGSSIYIYIYIKILYNIQLTEEVRVLVERVTNTMKQLRRIAKFVIIYN